MLSDLPKVKELESCGRLMFDIIWSEARHFSCIPNGSILDLFFSSYSAFDWRLLFLLSDRLPLGD